MGPNMATLTERTGADQVPKFDKNTKELHHCDGAYELRDFARMLLLRLNKWTVGGCHTSPPSVQEGGRRTPGAGKGGEVAKTARQQDAAEGADTHGSGSDDDDAPNHHT